MLCWFKDADGCVIATGNKDTGTTVIEFNGETFTFEKHLFYAKVSSVAINTKYPDVRKEKKKDALGFRILSEGREQYYYPTALSLGKKWIFQKSFSVRVFVLDGEPFIVYQVGPRGDSSHYYCIHDNNRRTVGIIERNTREDLPYIASIYIEEEAYLRLSILVASSIMYNAIMGDTLGSSADFRDPSGGRYISLHKEETEMLDKIFLSRNRV